MIFFEGAEEFSRSDYLFSLIRKGTSDEFCPIIVLMYPNLLAEGNSRDIVCNLKHLHAVKHC
jgi:hypothetical protein